MRLPLFVFVIMVAAMTLLLTLTYAEMSKILSQSLQYQQHVIYEVIDGFIDETESVDDSAVPQDPALEGNVTTTAQPEMQAGAKENNNNTNVRPPVSFGACCGIGEQ